MARGLVAAAPDGACDYLAVAFVAALSLLRIDRILRLIGKPIGILARESHRVPSDLIGI
jgi:hypothetical protein